MEERKLDTRTILGFALMMVAVMWIFYTQPTPEQQQEAQKETLTTENKEEFNNAPINFSDSLALAKYQSQLGAFGYSLSLPSAKEDAFTEIENEVISLKINNKGGQITEVFVKDQLTYDKKPVYLIKDNNSNFGIEFATNDNRTLNTKDLFFEPSVSGNSVSLKLKSSENQYIEYIYSLRPNEYMVDFQVRSVGLNNILNHQKNSTLTWDFTARRMERSVTYENRYTQAIAQYEDDRIEKLSEGGEDKEDVKQVNWIGFKQHLFSSFLITDKPFSSANITSNSLVKDEDEQEHFTKSFHFSAPLEVASGEWNEPFHLYFGPSDYQIFKKYNDKYELTKAIPLGWGIFGWINKGFVIPVFDFLSNYMSVGIAIIVLTIIVRILLSPIQYKSYLSQAKMKALKPEIEEINNKFKEPMKRQQETMALYNKAGVNPMSGCIPALLQMPVFFALFSFFPAAFILRNKEFLWAKDLSSYDSVFQLPFTIPFYGNHISLFPILASLMTFIYMLMTTGQMQQPKQEGVPNMKFMIYLSPIMMLFFFNNYASGLSLYYFISNLITILIMLAIKYLIIDEKKIHAKIEENKQKPRKESKFQRKMREMMEQAEAQRKQQKK
ncbi:MAG: membrane protein insertase YidC [Capnocytophaga sp.]|nr:membrane protein insertase YidC [Capnocytophaga sp.]